MILSKKALRLATAAIAAGFAGAAMSTSAFADWHGDRDHDYHRHHHWHHPPAVVVVPRPYYEPPPAVVYVPPATVYEPVAPPPVIGLGFNIRLR